jgi:hypothetical protein
MCLVAWNSRSAAIAKTLFGRSTRVALADWILDRDAAFFQLEAQDALRAYGEAASAVTQELRKFVDVGMLAETPDGRRVYFTKLDSPLWGAFAAIATALDSVTSVGEVADRTLSSDAEKHVRPYP